MILNGILAHSAAPELSLIVAGTFLLGLAGVTYLSITALKPMVEWLAKQIM
ncbi:MAG: hypothetical protein M1324_04505 [Patescibacteria group bacterium]|nr:hypothetical protein [Patescibacteria group bacterium]